MFAIPPPYYAVIFSNTLSNNQGYQKTADRMLELVQQQPGYLGHDSARSDGLGITVSYWKDLDSIKAWKKHPEHLEAQRLGKEKWYSTYSTKICKVEREYRLD